MDLNIIIIVIACYVVYNKHLLKFCYGANVNCFVFMKKFINFVNDKNYNVHNIVLLSPGVRLYTLE